MARLAKSRPLRGRSVICCGVTAVELSVFSVSTSWLPVVTSTVVLMPPAMTGMLAVRVVPTSSWRSEVLAVLKPEAWTEMA